MNGKQASAIGGLAAGLMMSLAMVVGRRSGLLH
jgi:PDZ domain-containing secreted protein